MSKIQVVGLVLMLAGSPAKAGVVDSPLPAPFTQHVFTVPGIANIAGLGTYFSCTNLDAASVTIGVELFGFAGGGPGNDAAATSLSVAPGGTMTFGTAGAANLTVFSLIGSLPSGSGNSARILATSKKIACNAFVADPANGPPTSGWPLTIIAKTKQKAAN